MSALPRYHKLPVHQVGVMTSKTVCISKIDQTLSFHVTREMDQQLPSVSVLWMKVRDRCVATVMTVCDWTASILVLLSKQQYLRK